MSDSGRVATSSGAAIRRTWEMRLMRAAALGELAPGLSVAERAAVRVSRIAESDLLHGRHTAAEAVPGGTIAQRDHPRRRGEDAA